MKIIEIITESNKGTLPKPFQGATPGLVTYSQLDNNNSPYLAYRFGIALAASPAENDNDSEAAIGSRFTMIDFSDADEEIRRGAEKKMNIQPTTNTGRGSHEVDGINKQSPLKAVGPITLRNK
jgi:hypothetical protein